MISVVGYSVQRFSNFELFLIKAIVFAVARKVFQDSNHPGMFLKLGCGDGALTFLHVIFPQFGSDLGR